MSVRRSVRKRKPDPQVVVTAIIERDGHILIAKRKHGKVNPGSWEFPGGTLEEGEAPEECLKRELKEELSIVVEVGDPICATEYAYAPEWTIKLIAYRTTVVSGVYMLTDHEEMRWVKPTDLVIYDFPEASRPIIVKLILELCGNLRDLCAVMLTLGIYS